MTRLFTRLCLTLTLAATLLLADGAAAQFSFGGIKNSLIQFALKQVSVEGVFEIRAKGIEQPADGVTDLVGVEIADSDGVWLTAEALSLRWNSGALLGGTLDIDRLAARGLNVLRRPIPPEVTVNPDAEIAQGPSRGLLDWPRAPITVRLRELVIEGAFLAAGVAAPGKSIAFDATGSAQDGGDIQAAALSITRTDGIEGRIVFDFIRDFAARSLAVKLDATEAPGGLVAALIGLPDDSAANVNLTAEGPLTDWRLALTAAADRVLDLEATGKLDVTGPLQAEASLRVRPGEALPVQIAAAIGDEAQLDLKIAEGEGGVVTVEAGRLRSPSVKADLSGTYEKATAEMKFDVALTAGQALAQAIEGVDFTSFGFSGKISGTPTDLSALGTVDLAGLATAPVDLGRATLQVDVTTAGQVITADVTGAASGVRIDKLGPEVMGATDLTVRAVWHGAAQTAELREVRISSPLLTVSASGTADLGADAAALAWSLATPDLAPVAAAYGVDAAGRLRAEGRATGALSAPRLVGSLTAEALRLDAERLGVVTLSHDVILGAAPSGTVDLTAGGGRFGPAKVTTAFAMKDGALTLSELSADVMQMTVAGRARVDTATNLTDADLAIDAPRLAALRPMFDMLALGAPPEGAINGDVTLRHQGGRQNAGLALTGSALAAMGYGAGTVRIDLDVTDALGAPGATGKVTASRIVGPDGIEVSRLTFTGEARDLTGAPSADGTLTADAIKGPDGIEVGRLTLDAKARDLTGAPGVDARFDVTAGRGPGGVAVDRASGTLTARDLTGDPAAVLSAVIEGLSASGASLARVDIDADLTGLSGAPRGTALVRATRIVAGGAAVASARLDATLSGGNAGATDVAATLTAPGVAMGDLRLGAVKVTAAAADALGAPRLDVVGSVRGGTAAGASLAGLRVTAKGPLEALAIVLKADGVLADGRAVTLDTGARADLSGPEIRATIAKLEANLAEGEGRDPTPAARIALEKPLTVRSGAGGQSFDTIALALPGGRLVGRARLAGGVSGKLDLTMDDLRPLARLTGAPLDAGALSVAATFNTGAGTAEFTAQGTGLRPTDIARSAGALSLDATGRWRGGRLKIEASLGGGFGDPFALDADLPLRAAGLVPVMPAKGTIDAGVKWRGEIGPLWALVPLADHILEGRLDLDLRVNGTVAAPQPAGDVALTGGRYENLETGTILSELTVTSGLAADGAMTLDMAAKDGGDRPVTARATIADGRIDARLGAEAAVLLRRDDATAAISLDIVATGPLASPAITGDVVIDRAEIRLVNATPPSVADLGEVEIKGAPRPPAEKAGAAEGGPTLDLQIRAPGGIFVRGRGLTSEWEADLTVTGPAGAPRITGAVEKRRGELRLLSRPFILTRGRVVFDGGTDIDPTLDVALELDRDDVVGRIAVRGRASAPEIVLESSPPLPEEEVLPRILFGQSRQSLTAAQATELASAAAQLASGDEGFLGALREAAGLDVLSVDLGAGGGPSVEVGRTVAEGVYVGAKQPVDGGATEVEVEVEIFDNFTLNGAAGGDGAASVGLDWKIDF